MARKRKIKSTTKRNASRNPAQLIALAALGVGIILIIGLVILSQTTKQPPTTTVAASEDMLALGQQVYENTCAACHGENGEGYGIPQAPALNETEHAWHHPDGQIQEIIKNGGKVMPALGDQLTDEEIVAVIRYIQTWWEPEQLRQQQARSLQYPLKQ